MQLTVRQEHAGRPKPYSDSQGRYWAARLKGSLFARESYADAWAPTEPEALDRLREKVCLWPGREVREQAMSLICARSQGGRRASRSFAQDYLGKRVGVWTASNGTYAGKLVEVVARKGAPWRAIVLIDTILSPASPEFSSRRPRQGFRRGDEIEVGGSSVSFAPEPPSSRSYLDLVKGARRQAYENAEIARAQLEQLKDPSHPQHTSSRARASLGTTVRIPPLWDKMLEAVQSAPPREARVVGRPPSEAAVEEARQRGIRKREEEAREAEKAGDRLTRGPWASLASQIPGLSGVKDIRDPQGRDQAVAAKWKRLGGATPGFLPASPIRRL